MKCHLCSPAQVLHQSLLDHLLADHPNARLLAGLALTIGTGALARRPNQLLAFHAAVTLAALVMANSPRRTA
jgi:hypothetical protein